MLAPPDVAPAPGRGEGGRSWRLAAVAALVAGTVVAGSLGARWALTELGGPGCAAHTSAGSHELTPEQAANAATITMVGVDRELGQRAVTIALATAIQESKLRNLNYGDADSLGLFQQRPSQGWGTADEVRDPVYASGAFYDALVRVADWETGELTVVAQAVQRSAYPDAYADHEDEALALSTALTGEEAGTFGCRLDEPEGRGSAAEVLDKAQRQFDGSGTAGGSTVVLDAPDPRTAWAIAAWAVAHAEAEDIVRVEVAGRAWDREGDPTAWTQSPGGDETSVTVVVATG